MFSFRRLGLGALVILGIAFSASPAYAAGPTSDGGASERSAGVAISQQKGLNPDIISVCGSERLSLVKPDGSRLTQAEITTGSQMLLDYCKGNRSANRLRDGGATTQGTAYGTYLRVATTAPLVTCPCGPTYRTFSIDVNATGVPYRSYSPLRLNTLGMIWRVTPGSGAWQFGGTRNITTYGSLLTVSGTMSRASYVTAIATVYSQNGGGSIDNLQSSAP